MGGSSWSDASYSNRVSSRAATNTPAFSYDTDVKSGKAPTAVHAAIDPKLTAGATSPFVGKVMRESRDSADHPESLAIGVIFDVTGSMGQIPVTLEKKLAGLMSLLIQKGYVAHPQILFGAIGDAYSDRVPLQIGQFESGLEMDDVLEKIYLEGYGGGQQSETYELAHYFFAKHTSIDCWDKRQKKGYLFTMGDEACYPNIMKEHVEHLIGDTLEANLSTAEVVKELSERYHVFHIIVEEGSYPHNTTIEKVWTDLLGERVLKLEDQNNVAELIALTIGLTEGTLQDMESAKTDLASVGLDPNSIDTVTRAVVPYAAKSGALSRSEVTGDLPTVSGGGTTVRI